MNKVFKILCILISVFSSFVAVSGPDETVTLGNSEHVGKVVINEVNNSADSYIELYFNEGVDVTDWTLIEEGQGGNAQTIFEVCSFVADPTDCSFYPAGTFLILYDVDLHNTLQEILLVDTNTLDGPNGTDILVHYLRYTNNDNSGGDWSFEPEDPDSGTIVENPGNEGNICSKPDGSTDPANWGPCEETPLEPNLPPDNIGVFQIVHDGIGLTCEAEPVEIRACTDNTCGTIDTSITTDVTLTVNGIGQTVSIVNGYSTGASFVYVQPNTATLALASDYVCLNTGDGSSSCDVIFSDAGFVIDTVASPSCDIQQLQLRAVQKNQITNQCEGALVGEKLIDFDFNYNLPTSGTKLPVMNGSALAQPGTKKSYLLEFDQQGVAVINQFSYGDAGKINLNSSFTETTGEYAGLYLQGQSELTFYPTQLKVNARKNNTDNTLLDGNANEKAGNEFSVSISAQCTDGTITTNYQPQTINAIEIITERSAPIDPILGANGTLVFNDKINLVAIDGDWNKADIEPASFISGEYIDSTSTYSEVGLITLAARDINYFGQNISSANQTIGRFTPHHFMQVTDIDGTLTTSCNDFAYSGEMDAATQSVGAIHYLVAPEIRIEPYNAFGAVTKNYINEFMMLTPSSVTVTAPLTDQVQVGKDGSLVALTAQISAGEIMPNETAVLSGNVNYVFSAMDNFVYTKNSNAKIAPFISSIPLEIISVVDSDGVSTEFIDFNGDPVNAVQASVAASLNIKFGRWNLQDTFGPETENLAQIMQLEYFDGSSYLLNTQDNCTVFTESSMVLIDLADLDPNSTSVTDETPSSVTFNAGETIDLELTAPNEVGKIGVGYQAPSWLQSDWLNENDFNENPTAEATFGRFNQGKRIINKKEIDK
ncbi:DUF6701 domain-containing protein [Thalassomonas sp. M1454]|uniref:DUF6701 domain-containing protein n=1 Tax=Thalassomonas sp. M1454 TaxID=2594477 RepID=UPI00117E12A6|nr:DUF6701 domain-containing protein [Thalassomonas sp. M1454]TRX52799.1 hypothetical protein FNN08_15690 [Thalassomonas sp. M1454]